MEASVPPILSKTAPAQAEVDIPAIFFHPQAVQTVICLSRTLVAFIALSSCKSDFTTLGSP
jgi:hypothetical protein